VHSEPQDAVSWVDKTRWCVWRGHDHYESLWGHRSPSSRALIQPWLSSSTTATLPAEIRTGCGKRRQSGEDMARTLDEAIEELKRDPSHPVRARSGDLEVEARVVAEPSAKRSAADALGESTEEVLELLADARRKGSQRSLSSL
jgi:hypothetical protein